MKHMRQTQTLSIRIMSVIKQFYSLGTFRDSSTFAPGGYHYQESLLGLLSIYPPSLGKKPSPSTEIKLLEESVGLPGTLWFVFAVIIVYKSSGGSWQEQDQEQEQERKQSQHQQYTR